MLCKLTDKSTSSLAKWHLVSLLKNSCLLFVSLKVRNNICYMSRVIDACVSYSYITPAFVCSVQVECSIDNEQPPPGILAYLLYTLCTKIFSMHTYNTRRLPGSWLNISGQYHRGGMVNKCSQDQCVGSKGFMLEDHYRNRELLGFLLWFPTLIGVTSIFCELL